MMLAAEVYDVSPRTSAVTILREHGVDPWVVDFGAPEQEEGGLERTLTDHVLAVSEAVDRVRAAHRARGASRRATRRGDVLLPDRRVPAGRRAQLGDHVRKPRRHAAGDAVRAARAARGRRRRRCSRTACSAAGRSPRGPAGPASGCLTRSSRCAAGSSSSCSCTTARRCFRVKASAASSRPTAGWPGRVRRWPTSSGSSSPTTGCSRAGS